MLYVLVGAGFQVLFHSPPGVLFTFPSQYYSLSVTGEYLGLEGGPPASHGVSRVPRYSGFCQPSLSFAYTTLTLFGLPSHAVQLDFNVPFAVRNPAHIAACGLASSAFARHYLRNLG